MVVALIWTVSWARHACHFLAACCPFAPSLPLVATQRYYVLDGQHKYAAASEMRSEWMRANRELPTWCTTFRCRVVRPDLTVDTLQAIAGRMQAQASAVEAMSYSETMQLFLNMWRAEVQSTPNKVPSRSEVLRRVYIKSGKSIMVDGAEVPCLAMVRGDWGRGGGGRGG